jgi:hypothetical protein
VAKNSQEKAAWIMPVHCTKGIPTAVYWDCCKDKYRWDKYIPKLKEDCKRKSEIKATLCMTQRTCVNKATAEDAMMKTYGKTSLLSKKNNSCDLVWNGFFTWVIGLPILKVNRISKAIKCIVLPVQNTPIWLDCFFEA